MILNGATTGRLFADGNGGWLEKNKKMDLCTCSLHFKNLPYFFSTFFFAGSKTKTIYQESLKRSALPLSPP